MTPGSHGSTFGGNPLAVAAANAVLDVMLKPGFFEHVQKMSLLLKQKLASVVDRHPDVLAEVRGEGLLIGLKAVVPSGDLVNALRDAEAAHGRRRRQCGAVPAAADRDRSRDRGIRAAARARLRRAVRRPVETGGGAMSKALRHFLDLNELPTKELRNMLDASVAMKAKLKAHEKGQAGQAARRQDAGDDLREALDPHAGVVRCRHAPARRRIDHADRRGNAARPRRDHRRHRARAVALCRCHHDPHPQP